MSIINENLHQPIPPRITKLKTKLESWLNQNINNYGELRQLLKGYSLPSFGRDEEPYSWILRGLEDLDAAFTQKMASRVASFLENTKPDQYIVESDDKKFLYNLFNICAGLRRKDELAEPLAQVFDYFRLHKDKEIYNQIFVDKRYYDIEGAFREALIANQINKKYISVWKNILNEEQEFLSSKNPFNGFRGVLFVNDNNEPAIDEIGWALGKIAEYLYRINDKKRHEKFPRLIERVKEVWNSDKYKWDEILFFQAKHNKWQDWAVVRLDKLLFPLSKAANGRQRYFIWEIYLPFLEELQFSFNVISREGIACEIEASPAAIWFLEQISPAVENNRKKSSNKSYEGVKLASNEAFKELVEEFKLNGRWEMAKATERARFKVLASKLPASQQQKAAEALVMVATN